MTVTALKIDNGNTFVEVTDATGQYRLALRPGIYRVHRQPLRRHPGSRGQRAGERDYTTPYPLFNKEDLKGDRVLYAMGIKFDSQVSPKDHVVRLYRYHNDLPYDPRIVGTQYTDGYSNYHGLQTAFNKRFSIHWQGTVTYALSGLKDISSPWPGPTAFIPVATAACPAVLGGEYTLAATDQRHRLVANGIWTMPYDIQLSGLYFYGSGLRYSTTFGGDRRLHTCPSCSMNGFQKSGLCFHQP